MSPAEAEVKSLKQFLDDLIEDRLSCDVPKEIKTLAAIALIDADAAKCLATPIPGEVSSSEAS